jgi:hypothetical protein
MIHFDKNLQTILCSLELNEKSFSIYNNITQCSYLQVIFLGLTWLKMNHIRYKNTTMNMDVLNTLLENHIP